jgi:hypothetical protein
MEPMGMEVGLMVVHKVALAVITLLMVLQH